MAVERWTDEMLDKLAEKVNQLAESIAELRDETKDFDEDLSPTQKWQDRTWTVIKWVGGISTGVSISAAIILLGLGLRFAATGR
ncbi:MAG: hypothetical protein KME35_17065 [Aphanocapsa sp. GSE-SYN-MK-11-07L]|jgi:hypothetical protein|nr:hypothetical protein [Aphanocapsa sp. GSE-SYN-MK-11-07L]